MDDNNTPLSGTTKGHTMDKLTNNSHFAINDFFAVWAKPRFSGTGREYCVAMSIDEDGAEQMRERYAQHRSWGEVRVERLTTVDQKDRAECAHERFNDWHSD